jgi:hypothetical protein
MEVGGNSSHGWQTDLRVPPHGWEETASSMTTHIKLYGGKAELFESIKEEMTEELGYEPTNPEVVGALMARYNSVKVQQ